MPYTWKEGRRATVISVVVVISVSVALLLCEIWRLTPPPLWISLASIGLVWIAADILLRSDPKKHLGQALRWYVEWRNLKDHLRTHTVYLEMRELAFLIISGSLLLVVVFAAYLFHGRAEKYADGLSTVKDASCEAFAFNRAGDQMGEQAPVQITGGTVATPADPPSAESRSVVPTVAAPEVADARTAEAPKTCNRLTEKASPWQIMLVSVAMRSQDTLANISLARSYCFVQYNNTSPNRSQCQLQASFMLALAIKDVLIIMTLAIIVFILTWLNFVKSLGSDLLAGATDPGRPRVPRPTRLASKLARNFRIDLDEARFPPKWGQLRWTTSRGLHEPVGDIFTMQGIAFTFMGLAFGLGKLPGAVGDADGIDLALAEGSAVYTSSLALGLVASLLGVILATGAKWLHARYELRGPDAPEPKSACATSGDAPTVSPGGGGHPGGMGPLGGTRPPGDDEHGPTAPGGPGPGIEELRGLRRTIEGLVSGLRGEILRILDERMPNSPPPPSPTPSRPPRIRKLDAKGEASDPSGHRRNRPPRARKSPKDGKE